MPKKLSADKQYRVLNPNGLPPGVPILSWRESNWYEGDILMPPLGMKIERILKSGYIEEIRHG